MSFSCLTRESNFCRNFRKKGYGKRLMAHWEADMKSKGYEITLTSTQVDENAQHFYRKLGYKDCGGLFLKDYSFRPIVSRKGDFTRI